MNTKKPRQESVRAETIGVVDSMVVHVSSDGSIEFGPEFKNAKRETTYDRPKGEKVVGSTPGLNNFVSASDWEFLRKSSEHLFAVDTNSRTIDGLDYSATGIVHVTQEFLCGNDGVQKQYAFRQVFGMAYEGLALPRENIGWLQAYELAKERCSIDPKQLTFFVVDSDLGNHEAFNSKRKPIYDQYYFSGEVKLIYASSDTGKDLPFNNALSVADSISTQILNSIQRGEVTKSSRGANPPHWNWYGTVTAAVPQNAPARVA